MNEKQGSADSIIQLITTISFSRLFLLSGVSLIIIAALGRIGTWVNQSSIERVVSGIIGIGLTLIGWQIERSSRRIYTPSPERINKNQRNQNAGIIRSKFSSLEPIAITGYFYVENQGKEEILVKANESHDLPIFQVISSGIVYEESILDAIRSALKDIGIRQAQFLKAGFSKPEYHQIYRFQDRTQRAVEQTPYIFVKVRLYQKFDCSINSSCHWQEKSSVIKRWDANHTVSNLRLPGQVPVCEAIDKDFYYELFGQGILEGVDLIIFKIDVNQTVRFLMLKRLNNNSINIDWEYPKGGIRYYETPLQGALRVAQAETNIRSNALKFCADLGWQTVDVSNREKAYKILNVHSYAFYFTGSDSNIQVGKSHLRFDWVTLNEVQDRFRESTWITEYGLEFFRRWEEQKENILRKASL